ncbi:MAG: hypothetical protein AB1458_03915 [Bacteroidota bacterium]
MRSLIALLLALPLVSIAQDEKTPYIHKGLFRSVATLSAGRLLNEHTSTIFIQGNIEYYVADHVSIRGEGFYMIQSGHQGAPVFEPYVYSNHQVFSGANFHLRSKSHFDPYIGFEPGVAISKAVIDTVPADQLLLSKQTVNPAFSCMLGFNYYFEKLFHLFMEARYVHGRHLSNGAALSLNELRFSFGLGWNLSFNKKAKQD